MANLARVRVGWNGTGVVGPGVSTFYFAEGSTGFPGALNDFFDAVRAAFPTAITVDIPSSGDLIDVGSGEITGTWSEPGGATLTGTNGGQFALGVGCRVQWLTNGVVNRRRVVGSTFLVPLNVGVYDGAGALTTPFLDGLIVACSDYLDAVGSSMRVWHRPKNGAGGSAATVTDFRAPDKVSWLRSRRT